MLSRRRGTHRPRGGRWLVEDGTDLLDQIPEGLRDVIGRRMSRLGESCNALLAVASVIGREFDLETLQSVVDISEDELELLPRPWKRHAHERGQLAWCATDSPTPSSARRCTKS